MFPLCWGTVPASEEKQRRQKVKSPGVWPSVTSGLGSKKERVWSTLQVSTSPSESRKPLSAWTHHTGPQRGEAASFDFYNRLPWKWTKSPKSKVYFFFSPKSQFFFWSYWLLMEQNNRLPYDIFIHTHNGVSPNPPNYPHLFPSPLSGLSSLVFLNE